MKTRIILLTALFLLTLCKVQAQEKRNALPSTDANSINISAGPELLDLARNWSGEFNKANPGTRINILETKDMQDAIMRNNSMTLALMDASSLAALKTPPAWSVVIGRTVTVPVMNKANPLLAEINRRGISAENLAMLFGSREKSDWGIILGTGAKLALNYYTYDDRSVQESLSNYLPAGQVLPAGKATDNAREMLAAISNDPNGLGFCRLSDLTGLNGNLAAGAVCLVPVDRNGNGRIDFMEDIYDTPGDFARGVWIGKYPKALTGNIYAVAQAKPQSGSEVAFMNWVLTNGQQSLGAFGYCELVSGERQTQLDKLREEVIVAAAPVKDNYAILKTIILVLLAFAALGFITDILGRYFRGRRIPARHTSVKAPAVFDLESVRAPKGLFYDHTHTWTFMESDGTVKIGIDDFLQHITGPVSRISLLASGERIKKGEHLLTLVQNGKKLNILSPVTGTIIAQNQELIADASLLNSTPINQGWVYRIEPANWSLEIQFMSMSGMYKSWLKDEFIRLKDFFAMVNMPGTPAYAQVALQDGGTFTNNILENFGPEVWDDFQTKFIDNTR